MKYYAAAANELYARGLILTSAMQKFAKFLDLPESSSRLAAIFDVAFSLLSLVQPELLIGKLFMEEEKAVTLALSIAEAAGDRRVKALRAAQKVGGAVEKGVKARDTVTAIAEKAAKTEPPPEGVSLLSKLDASKKPIYDLIESSKKMENVWSKALDTLDLELENRLSDLNSQPSESLLALAQRLLVLPKQLTRSELAQVELLYLYYMIGSYVKSDVVVVETTRVIQIMRATTQTNQRGSTTWSIVGLTDTQQDTIVALFGPGAARGKIFWQGALVNIWTAMAVFGARHESRTEHTTYITASGKM
jgi:hypothetical protein